jgi:hypothetical protein
MSPDTNAETEQAARRRRLTLTDVVEKLLDRGGSEHSSVTLSRNAKGETQIEVVVRTGEAGSVQTIEEAEAAAVTVYERLRARYPTSTGNVGAAGTPQP